jgi:pentose-5-phosphate-3-epimerase
MEIIPAILTNSTDEFKTQLNNLKDHFAHIQIDIADGEFVPGKTITVDDIIKTLNSLNPAILQPLSLDFDLLVMDSMSQLEKIEELGEIIKIKTVFTRPQISDHYKKMIQLYPEYEIGIAIDPADSIETIFESYPPEDIPVIQVMSVIPGAQGNSFIEDMLNKIEHLRMSDYRNKIYLDGGINDRTIKTIISKKYQPDVLCIGSYLTRADDLNSRVEKLRKVLVF